MLVKQPCMVAQCAVAPMLFGPLTFPPFPSPAACPPPDETPGAQQPAHAHSAQGGILHQCVQWPQACFTMTITVTITLNPITRHCRHQTQYPNRVHPPTSSAPTGAPAALDTGTASPAGRSAATAPNAQVTPGAAAPSLPTPVQAKTNDPHSPLSGATHLLGANRGLSNTRRWNRSTD